MKKFDTIMHKIMQPLYKNKGDILTKLLLHWPEIVGLNFASHSLPQKITNIVTKEQNYRELVIKVNNDSIAVQISFMQTHILERIKQFFGYKAIEKIKIIQ